jgi:alkylation response protein AidB-like acyl-CoA dehydrogenase
MDIDEFLARSAPLSRVRELAEAGGGIDRAHIRRASTDGYFLPLASGRSLSAASVVADHWGRSLVADPFVEGNVVADAITRVGSPYQRNQVLPDILAGDQIATWAGSDLPGYWGSAVGVRAEPDGFTLTGRASLVQHAGDADWILVAAQDAVGVSEFLVPADSAGLHVSRLAGLDVTRARYDVAFEDVRLAPQTLVGTRGRADVDRAVCVAVVLGAAQTVGTMGRLFELALDYAKSRIAFGRPIGSFQAIKHLLVDASLGLEMSRAMCEAAAEAVDAGQSEAAEVLSMAKAFVAKSGVDLAHVAWQVFGGISYMWQHDFHLYLRRITADAAMYGTAQWHSERICALHSLGVSA